jgi:dinuclear metal center YbgI/SA1388 family protein
MLNVAAIADFLERFAPSKTAAEWDNVGLLLGDRNAGVERVLTCLTVTPEVVAEALREGVNLIVTHHPILFRGAKRLTTSNPEGRMLLALAAAGVSVYSPHTAFDNAPGGINDALAARLGLVDVTPLRRSLPPGQYKVVVFVPEKDLQPVSDAMFAAGAGKIGAYEQCSFRLSGVGTFYGTDDANPTVGAKGRREEVSEWRLEVVCGEADVDRVVSAMRRAHSYEEPAYDVYSTRVGKPSSAGEGRVGRLAKPTTLKKLTQTVKASLSAAAVQVVGDAGRKVERVVVVCGAGGEFLSDAIRARADVFLTGEMRFHDYLNAKAHNVALVLPGHYATERCGIEELADRIQREWSDLKVWASKAESDPVQWM